MEPTFEDVQKPVPATLKEFIGQSPLWFRVTSFLLLGFLMGWVSRFSSPFASAVFLVLFLVLLALLVWVLHGGFAKSTGTFKRHKSAPRGLRILSGVTSIIIGIPILFSTGFNSALATIPYSEQELAFFEAQAAAEAELLRQQLEAEEAAQEAARAEQEARDRAEQERRETLERVAREVEGESLETATSLLTAAGVAFSINLECVEGEAGVVLSTAPDPNGIKLNVSATATVVPDAIGLNRGTATSLVRDGCYEVETITFYAAAPEGLVFQSAPPPDTPLEAGETVTLFVAERKTGTRDVADSVGNWSFLGPRDEDWGFWTPFEKDGKLFIPIRASHSVPLEWRDPFDTGSGFGVAQITDQFDKEVPVSVLYGKKSVPENEEHFFTVVVPLTDLDNQRPTRVAVFLEVEVNGNRDRIRANFTMSW